MRRPALLLAAVLAACGSDAEGVAVTEAAPDGALRAPAPGGAAGAPRPAPLDTAYADSGLHAEHALRPDSLGADTADADPPAAPPDFRAFWPRFRDAVRAGRGVDALVAPGGAAAFEAAAPVALAPPFRDGVLALGARDFRRAGTGREATVRVGYDRAGAVVAEDEAVREATATLRFDVVDGAYRLVDLRTAGRVGG